MIKLIKKKNHGCEKITPSTAKYSDFFLQVPFTTKFHLNHSNRYLSKLVRRSVIPKTATSKFSDVSWVQYYRNSKTSIHEVQIWYLHFCWSHLNHGFSYFQESGYPIIPLILTRLHHAADFRYAVTATLSMHAQVKANLIQACSPWSPATMPGKTLHLCPLGPASPLQ